MFNFTDTVVVVSDTYEQHVNDFQIVYDGDNNFIIHFPEYIGWLVGDTIEILATNGSIALVNKDWLTRQECSK